MASTAPYKTRHPKRRAFLAAFAETGNVTRAAELAGVSRQMHYEWLADATYAADFAAAEDQAADRLEQEARRRATAGVETRKLVLYRGEPVIDWSVPGAWVDDQGDPWIDGESRGVRRWTGAYLQEVETRYSDTLLIFLLKGARPEKYKDRQSHEHTGSGGGPIAIDDPRERLADLIARHAAAGAASGVAGEPDAGAG